MIGKMMALRVQLGAARKTKGIKSYLRKAKEIKRNQKPGTLRGFDSRPRLKL